MDKVVMPGFSSEATSVSVLLTSKALFAYNENTQELQTALGADLPGLYGRAITLCAGAPARKVDGTPSRIFKGVPAEAASILTTLMTD